MNGPEQFFNNPITGAQGRIFEYQFWRALCLKLLLPYLAL